MTAAHAWQIIESLVNDRLHEWNLNEGSRSELKIARDTIENLVENQGKEATNESTERRNP